jgi:ABC-type nitrate/sulfonate/bicarbonate transport system substrate-binding protein
LLLITWLSAAGAQEKSGAPRKLESVTLGLSAKHVLNLPIYLAQRHGIFESEGFDYKPITTKTNTAVAALVSSSQGISILLPRSIPVSARRSAARP